MCDFKYCKHCGEIFFAEDIDANGLCRVCNGEIEK